MNEQLNQFHNVNQPQAGMNRSYMPWSQHNSSQILMNPNFNLPNQSMAVRNNWKGKNKVSDNRRSGGAGYKPPTLQELQSQNRLKARRFYSKKKFNNRSAPYAPRNTTSYIIRAKNAGGIASLVSPCPVTPAVLPTPVITQSTEVLGDMAKEEWGVDGYGTMNGLIRLRDEAEMNEEGEGGSSDSDVEEHVEVERRLDHDLSRFEMIYPNSVGVDYNNVLENRVDDQTAHILHLEDENLTLKEKLFLMGREMEDLKRRLLRLERRNQGLEDANEEVVENASESESSERGHGDDNVNLGESNEGNNNPVVNDENVKDHKGVGNQDVVTMEVDNNNDAEDGGDLGMKDLHHTSVDNEDVVNEEEVKIKEDRNNDAAGGSDLGTNSLHHQSVDNEDDVNEDEVKMKEENNNDAADGGDLGMKGRHHKSVDDEDAVNTDEVKMEEHNNNDASDSSDLGMKELHHNDVGKIEG